MTTPQLGSILLASTDPDSLRGWYEKAFDVTPNADGFLEFGGVAVLCDRRDDVAARNPEPTRMILNFHVDDAKAACERLDALDVTWLAPLEYREGPGAWFATLADPDGNCVQVIELTEAYHEARRK